jgi:hypothetical protein
LEVTDWINLLKDVNIWRAFVSKAMNPRVHKVRGILE